MKQVSREILDRENRVLREAKSALESENSSLKQQLAKTVDNKDSLRQELHLLQSQKESEVAHLRAELKLTAYNLSALTTNYEVSCTTMLFHCDCVWGKVLIYFYCWVDVSA